MSDINDIVEMGPNGDRDPATGKFVVGWKGGPGRPRTTGEMRELFRDLTPAAVARLRELLHSENEDVALKALAQALNRGWGTTPVMAAAGDDEDGEGSGKPRVTVHIDLGG